MELDFDKEIDALLRRVAKSDADFAAAAETLDAPHLDADEISAFAENALPEKARKRSAAHLAGCDSCRKNLAALLILNAENAPEIAAAEKETAVIPAPRVPWYRKLFAFPNIAYTMGALVLAFIGLTAFIALQNYKAGNAEIAQSNTAPASNAASEAYETGAMNANTNSSAAPDFSAANSNSTANTANVSPQALPEISSADPVQEKSENQPGLLAESKPADETRDDTVTNLARSQPPQTEAGKQRAEEEKLSAKRAEENADAVVTAAPAPPAPKKSAPATLDRKNEIKDKGKQISADAADAQVKEDDREKQAAKGARLSSRARVSVGGKTFSRRNDVWYDSAYNNQPTTNVRRGTNEYRNLDSGLRSITDKLSGVVVIVWKTKAYRIQ